jgi:flagellar capping protein FliD
MATTVERLGIVETKVVNLDEKIDDLKIDVKDIHDCLDRTGDELKTQLHTMHNESCRQHTELASKIASMEKAKDKLMLYGAIGAAFIAGAGWSGAINFPMILKFFGI